MIEVYKTVKGVCHKEAASFLKMLSDVAQRQAGRGHDSRIYLQRATKLVRQKAFGLWIVTTLNSLTEEVVNSKNLNMFKNRLDKYWQNQDIQYNYRVALVTTTASKVNLGTDEHQYKKMPSPNITILSCRAQHRGL